jgi:phosphatidylcholine synthase
MPTWKAWAVHVLTASGAALALFAALAVGGHQWQTAFGLLGIAFIVDAIDGPLARAIDVGDRLPWINGVILDLVVDYATYVFVPALVLIEGPLLSPPYGAIAGTAVALVGALYFADVRMKTEASAFRGFPAVWNAVVFQLMIYKLPEAATLLILAILAVLTFAPVEFVHPVRVRRWRPLTLILTVAWAVLAVVALVADLNPPWPVALAFGLVNLYFALVGAAQQLTR